MFTQNIQLKNVSNLIGCLEYDLDFRIYGYGTFMSRDSTTCYNHKSFECDATVASLREYSGIGFGIERGFGVGVEAKHKYSERPAVAFL